MSAPISTFQRAAETLYKPSSSFGTGGRFDVAQVVLSDWSCISLSHLRLAHCLRLCSASLGSQSFTGSERARKALVL
jgi:hypothetical protein